MNFDIFFHRNSFLPRLTPILCLLCIASFLGLNLAGDNMTYEQSKVFGLYPPNSVWTGAPWSLLTSTFAHQQVMHLLFNVMWLWTLGNVFENEFGSLRWAVFFLVSAWVSSSLQLFSMGDAGIGMSGVGYALFGFGWVARRRFSSFAAILTRENVIIFLVWMVGCIVVTAVGAANIGNGAHVAVFSLAPPSPDCVSCRKNSNVLDPLLAQLRLSPRRSCLCFGARLQVIGRDFKRAVRRKLAMSKPRRIGMNAPFLSIPARRGRCIIWRLSTSNKTTSPTSTAF